MTLDSQRRFAEELITTDTWLGTPRTRLLRITRPLQAPVEARSQNGTFRYQFKLGGTLVVSARRFPTADAAVTAGEIVSSGTQRWLHPQTADTAESN